MEEWPKRKEHHLKEYDYGEAGYYFITICTQLRNQDVLSSIPTVGGGLCATPLTPDLTDLGKMVEASIQKIPELNPGAGVDLFCIMPDHLHLILTLEPGRDRARPLHDVIRRLKTYTQNEYRNLGYPFGPKLWQRDYYDHVIRNDADLRETRQYLQNNPARRQERSQT